MGKDKVKILIFEKTNKLNHLGVYRRRGEKTKLKKYGTEKNNRAESNRKTLSWLQVLVAVLKN